jgi:hypothetical protein
LVVVVVLSGAFVSTAGASQLITRAVASAHLKVNKKGIALITYRVRGSKKTYHVLAKGAKNARPPRKGGRQVHFKLDRAGGWKFFHNSKYWRHFKNVCRRYQGPPLPSSIKVAACTMPDGSHWALQAWKRMLKNYGEKTTGKRNQRELRLSHWNTDLPLLTITMDWSWGGQWDHLWGFYTYREQPVYGFSHSKSGDPDDGFGRNIYVDSFSSDLGKGWKRVNSFLTHPPTGGFCFGFSPKSEGGKTGKGKKYRATVQGPGVAPDVMWFGESLGPYDEALDAVLNQQQADELGNDPRCEIN